MTSPPHDFSSLVSSSLSSSSPSPARLKALYAFTSAQQQTNPSGYQANVAWWIQSIEDALREGIFGRADGGARDRLMLHAVEDTLTPSLDWPGVGRPKGIGGVLSRALISDPRTQQLAAKPLLVPVSRFLSNSYTPIDPAPSSSSSGISLTGLAAKPLWWLVGKVNPWSSGGGGEDANSGGIVQSEPTCWKRIRQAGNDLVWMTLLRESADKFIAQLAVNTPSNNSARLLTPEIFQQAYGRVCSPSRHAEEAAAGLSLKDCRVLLKYLAVDREVLVMDKEANVYKIVDASSDEVNEVTEADKGTVAVMSTLSRVEQQIAQVEREIRTATSKAKHYLSQGQKSTALTYLRSKKELEVQLDKRISVAEQLKTVLRGIDTAHGDVEIMRAYQVSASTLKSVLAHPSLQKDNVDATTEALADVMSDAHEIDQAVQLGGQLALDAGGHVEPDVDDLESELAALMAEPETISKGAVKPLPPKAVEEAPSTLDTGSPPVAKADRSQADWQRIHEDAQQREQDERARAAAERLAKESKLLAE